MMGFKTVAWQAAAAVLVLALSAGLATTWVATRELQRTVSVQQRTLERLVTLAERHSLAAEPQVMPSVQRAPRPAAHAGFPSERLADGARLPPEQEGTLFMEDGVPQPPPLPEEVAARLEHAFNLDPPDAAGEATALDLESLAVQPAVVQNGLVPLELLSECRAGQCRTVARFEDRERAEDWLLLYTTSAGRHLARSNPVRLEQPDGGVELRVYSTRQAGG